MSPEAIRNAEILEFTILRRGCRHVQIPCDDEYRFAAHGYGRTQQVEAEDSASFDVADRLTGRGAKTAPEEGA